MEFLKNFRSDGCKTDLGQEMIYIDISNHLIVQCIRLPSRQFITPRSKLYSLPGNGQRFGQLGHGHGGLGAAGGNAGGVPGRGDGVGEETVGVLEDVG